MLGRHLGIQREAAAPLSVTFEGKALVADSIFPPNSVLPFSLFYLFLIFFFFMGERDTCRLHLLH